MKPTLQRVCARFAAARVLLACVLAAGATASVQAQTIYYVDPVNGNDTSNGLSQEAPLKTVAAAIAKKLGPDDRLRLRADVVHGPTVFSDAMSGAQDHPIVVEPYGGNKVVFDGRVRQPDFGQIGNIAWERVPGHAGEWRSKDPLPAEITSGQFLDTKYRLITYARIDDLRAANESFPGFGVPLSDPRPGPGPLARDETRKIPWTYLGPGFHWVPENPAVKNGPGRVHIRLSRTHLNTPGTQDYAGAADPRQLALALTPETTTTVQVGAKHVRFVNLVIQNGGDTTLQITRNAAHVSFDHCEVYGARIGVRISGDDRLDENGNRRPGADDIRFEHCTFDGGLAPWTTRVDVKSEYEYVDASSPPPLTNNLGKRTHDILVISNGRGVEFANCTFRRAHDGIQIGSNDSSVHDSLFEDLNDEVLQFNAAVNVRVYKNLMRQVMHPLSFALNQTGGPLYVYRNVIDQRLPTRGYRTLPPDAPAPNVWRYGSDLKMGNPMPALFVYQNTFVASHPDDKANFLTLLFANSYESADQPRWHQNNVRLGVNLDVPLSWARPTTDTRQSMGNLWHLFHYEDAPWFRWDAGPGGGPPRRFYSLAAVQAEGWEQASVAGDPGLANFDGDIFERGPGPGEPYPSNDFRPLAGSLAAGAGMYLPDTWPDPDRPGGGRAPDIGALTVDGPPLQVGVDGAVVLPAPGVPIANADFQEPKPLDNTVTDAGGDGFEPVGVDGTLSRDPGGTLTAYAWTLNGTTLATKATANLYLPEGDNDVQLRVTDDAGNTDTDTVRIHIKPAVPHGDNLLQCPGFEEAACGWQLAGALSANGPVHTGKRALQLPAGSNATARQRVGVNPGTAYRISAWVRRTNLAVGTATLRAVFLNSDGTALQTNTVPLAATATYAYRETTALAPADPSTATVLTPADAVTMDLYLGAEVQAGTFYFDDVRVLDPNLLRNAGFETRPPTGQDDEAPHWHFVNGGQIVTDAAGPRSGARALAVEGGPDYRQVTQEVGLIKAVRRYRVSAWLKTVNLTALPKIDAAFDGGSEITIAQTSSEGLYRYVSKDLDAPVGAARMTVRLYLPKDASGTVYVDDFLVEPL